MQYSSYSCFCSGHNLIALAIAIFTIFLIFSREIYFPLTKIEISFVRFFRKIFLSEPISEVKFSRSSSIDLIIPLKVSPIPSVESKPLTSWLSSEDSKSFEYSSTSFFFFQLILILLLEKLFQNYQVFKRTFLLLFFFFFFFLINFNVLWSIC